MGRARAVGLAACLALLLGGCLDYREQLTLRADGSGSLVIDFVVDLGIMNEVAQAFGDQPDPNANKGPTKEEILQGLQVDGIEVKDLTVQHRGDKSKVHIELEFKSLAALGQMEGFGDDRRVDFFDNGDGKVRVVYSFDTTDVIPLEELDEGPGEGEQVDPVEKKILEVTERARAELKFRGRVELPGAILKSNGKSDPKLGPNTRVWVIDKEHDPKRHARLGRGKISMMMLVERATLPFVKELQPLPSQSPKDAEDDEEPRGAPPPARRLPEPGED